MLLLCWLTLTTKRIMHSYYKMKKNTKYVLYARYPLQLFLYCHASWIKLTGNYNHPVSVVIATTTFFFLTMCGFNCLLLMFINSCCHLFKFLSSIFFLLLLSTIWHYIYNSINDAVVTILLKITYQLLTKHLSKCNCDYSYFN